MSGSQGGGLACLSMAIAVGLSGCGSGSSDSTPSAASFAGTWTGTARVTRTIHYTSNTATMSTPMATLTLVIAGRNTPLTEGGVGLTGTWTMTFTDPVATAKQGALSVTAYETTDCDAGFGYIVIGCHHTYNGSGLKDLVLTGTGTCSTIRDALGTGTRHDLTGKTLTEIYLSTTNTGNTSCGVSYEDLSGRFTFTKQ